MIRLKDTITILILLFCIPNCIKGQSYATDLHPSIYLVEDHLIGFRNKDALTILDQIKDSLTLREEHTTAYAARILQLRGETLEKLNQDSLAQAVLHESIAIATKYSYSDLLAHTYLSLARLHEKTGNKEICKSYLDLAWRLLSDKKNEHILSRYYIRLSSYQRVFENNDSLALESAERALSESQTRNQIGFIGTSHMLNGYLNKNENIRLFHLSRAASIFHELGDYSGHAFIIGAMAKDALNQGKLSTATILTDSISKIIRLQFRSRMDTLPTYWLYQRNKAMIFASIGNATEAKKATLNMHIADSLMQITADDQIIDDLEYAFQRSISQTEIEGYLSQININKKFRYFLFAALFIVLIMFALLLAGYYRRKKMLVYLNQQNDKQLQNNNRLANITSEQEALKHELNQRIDTNLDFLIKKLESDEISLIDQRIHQLALIHELLISSTQESTFDVDIFFHQVIDELNRKFNIEVLNKPLITGEKISSAVAYRYSLVLYEIWENLDLKSDLEISFVYSIEHASLRIDKIPMNIIPNKQMAQQVSKICEILDIDFQEERFKSAWIAKMINNQLHQK